MQRFQKALASAADDHLFQNVPVDWWDAGSGVWRPTVVETTVHSPSGTREHATVAAPRTESPERCETRVVRVRIADLRPSQLLDEDVVQFYTTRYTLEIIDALQPCIELASPDEREQLQDVIDELWGIYRETGAAWRAAYITGCRDGIRRWSDEWVGETRLEEMPGISLGLMKVVSAISHENRNGEINCSPVVLWDEVERTWRPTLMLGATGDESQFEAWQEVPVLLPGEPVEVSAVPGSYLQPTEIADSCFSVFAIPVVARDILRMHQALSQAQWSPAEIARHPSVAALAQMLEGAAAEWRGIFEAGLPGPAPEPKVVPIHPSLWGLSTEGYTPVSDEA